MVNLEYYKVFYFAAKLGSITQAAEALFISQPAVSQAIRQLENSLGGSLFFRTPKGVRLTPEGEALFGYISRGYEYMELAESKFKELLDLEAGEIRIGASDMTLQFYLLPFLEQFNRLFPRVRIRVTNGPTPETLEYLRSGAIDFGVVSEPFDEEKGLKVSRMKQINDVFVAGGRFSGIAETSVEFSELTGYPVICLEKNTSTRKFVDAFMKERGTELVPEFELATSELIVQFAVKGLGIGCVVRSFAQKLIDSGELFEVKLKTPFPTRYICVVTLDRMPVSPAGSRLLNMLKP